MITIFMFALVVCGVFGDEVKSVSVMEGDSLTLYTEFIGTQRDEIKWRFAPEGSSSLLVHIDGITSDIKNVEGFKDRLQISNIQTGDLIIKNMRKNHAGLYKAEIEGATGTVRKSFNVIVYDAPDVLDAGTGEVKSVSVTEGESVTLQTDVNLQRDALILWRFGHEGALIAKDDVEDNKTPEFPDERFRDKLQVNNQTGDLIIKDLTYLDSGVYKLKISSNKQITHKTFSLSVREEGLSAVAVGFIVFFSLFVAAAVPVGVFLYHSWMAQKKLIDEMETIEVIEGYPLLLDSGVADIQTDDVIEWRFEETLIAEIKRNNDMITQKGVGIFGDRLQLKSGNLKIKDISMKHAGLYKVKIINSKGTSCFLFNVIVKARVRTVALRGSVTIPTGLKQIKDIHKIEWKFKKSPENELLLAEIHGTSKVISEYSRERFNGRLIVDPKTGDLIINQVTAVDTGVYILHDMTGKRQRNYYVALCEAGTKGDDVILKTGSKSEVNTEVEWSFTHEVNSKDKKRWVTGIIKSSCDAQNASGRFRRRVKMNTLTGDLTITKIKRTDAGFYTLKLIKTDGEILYRIFKVDVSAFSGEASSNSDDDEDLQDSKIYVNQADTGNSSGTVEIQEGDPFLKKAKYTV